MDRLEHAVKHSKILTLQREDRGNKRGFIYLIECHTFVKVGYAENVNLRLCQLQMGNPYELRLLASFKTQFMQRDERRLHELWKRFEVRGEWFQVPAGELAFVSSAKDFDDIFTSQPEKLISR